MSDPIKVREVAHRTFDKQGRRLGHVGYIQRRAPSKVHRNGGAMWASWARLTTDGIETGTPERYESYKTEDEARAHAEYAAGRSP